MISGLINRLIWYLTIQKTEANSFGVPIKMKFLSTEPKTQKLNNKKGSNTDTLRRVLLTTQAKVIMLCIFKKQ